MQSTTDRRSPGAILLVLTRMTAATAVPAQAITFHVSPQGNDAWSGRHEKPNLDRTDGPLASLAGARESIRKLKAQGPLAEPVNVVVADGTYTVTEPVVFEPGDSGTKDCPITYAAAAGANPVFTGGRTIAGFKAGPDGTLRSAWAQRGA